MAAARPSVPGFELGNCIATSGRAAFHAGRRRGDGRPVEIILIEPADDHLEPFVAEQQALAARPPHPQIPVVLAAGRADSGHAYVVWCPVEGTPLRAELGGPFGLGRLALLAELAAPLTALHRAGVAHGGLDPDSILRGLDGRLVLARPGIAPFLDVEHTDLDTFRAPDRAGRTSATVADDVYALGAFGSLLLTGRLDQVATVAEAPGHIVSSLWRALDPDPTKRQWTVDELLYELRTDDQAVVGAEGELIEGSAAPMPPAELAPRRWPVLLGVVALLAMVVGASGLLDSGDNENAAVLGSSTTPSTVVTTSTTAVSTTIEPTTTLAESVAGPTIEEPTTTAPTATTTTTRPPTTTTTRPPTTRPPTTAAPPPPPTTAAPTTAPPPTVPPTTAPPPPPPPTVTEPPTTAPTTTVPPTTAPTTTAPTTTTTRPTTTTTRRVVTIPTVSIPPLPTISIPQP